MSVSHFLPAEWIVSSLEVALRSICFIILPLIFIAAYLSYFERRILGAMQLRKGPNQAGPFGLLQPLADALKLVLKEFIHPQQAHRFLFVFAPILTFVFSLSAWAVIPVGWGMALTHLNVSLLYVFAISSFGVYAVLIAGWASNSQYAFLGGLRAAAQMISYELIMGVIILSIVISSQSLDLQGIVKSQANLWYIIPHFPIAVLFFITMLAETNRAPFDFAEADSELVAGYHVEYSGVGFAYFFLAEYANMTLMSSLMTILFLGGWLPPFSVMPLTLIPGPIWFGLKVSLLLFIFIWVRGTLPRYRYDQFMHLSWKIFLPMSLAWSMGTAGVALL